MTESGAAPGRSPSHVSHARKQHGDKEGKLCCAVRPLLLPVACAVELVFRVGRMDHEADEGCPGKREGKAWELEHAQYQRTCRIALHDEADYP